MKPLHVGIDARLVTNRRGMGNVLFSLLDSMARLPDDFRFTLYLDDEAGRGALPQDPRFTAQVIGTRLYPAWEQISLPRRAAKDRVPILHCPANSGPLCLAERVKLILTIHDVMYLMPVDVLPKSPSLYQRMGRLYRRLVVPPAASRAAAIVTVSMESRKDILEQLDVDPSRLHVVHDAPGSLYRRMEASEAHRSLPASLGVRQPFILVFGGVDPRKNTHRHIEAFARFRGRVQTPFQLVIAGLRDSEQKPFLDRALAFGVNSEIVMTGFVPEERLVALYNCATMLVYCSLYEGFGLPVVEAMACGTPVITSPRGALREVAGDASRMVDPLSVDAISEAMVLVALDVQLREKMILEGTSQARKFSWRESAIKMLEIYRSVGES